jgi:lipopolysaccharide transport system permease protein
MSNHRIVLEAGSAERHYWRDLWNYRGLFWFLAWRDILVRYKQTTIGIALERASALAHLAVMAFIGWLFESQVPGDVPRLAPGRCRHLAVDLLQHGLQRKRQQLIANSNLLTKVYFPRLIVPAAP